MNTPNAEGLDPIKAGPFQIGFIDAIHGQGAECGATTVTKDEVEQLVQSYLADIVGIDEFWELVGSTGSWEARWKPYANRRISYFVEQGMISEQRVKEMAEEAYAPLNKLLNERPKQNEQIGAADGMPSANQKSQS